MDQQQTSWAVTRDGVRHQLTLSAEGLSLRESDGEGVAHYSWAEVPLVVLPTPLAVELHTQHAGVITLAVHAGVIQRELRETLRELGVDVRTPPTPVASLPDPDDRVTPRRPKYVDGAGYLALGLVINVIGVLMLLASSNAQTSEAGDGITPGYVIAWLTLGVGSLVSSIGVIAIGVTIGLRRAVDLLGPPSQWGARR
ncbi:hypothetical protein [Nocardioides sp. cx-173]|uniref:hypothetical protein n=1 Tax=Nocardioides sp. cx-173 TaxID=2898796 RepID=UPI001E5C3438|nr:hypothetical protein [Nocardioides sp. cx-173]MCD4525116.1 hypothetical protein [Nocardioides sp. cx-173]UGB40181.1 hypothetical protein LQ940_12345 [Nocardioides sp. cx-173]